METETQLEVYRQTIEALNAQNQELKAQLESASKEITRLNELINIPDNGVHKAYQELMDLCHEAMAYRNEIREAARECALAKEQYMQELKRTILSLY